MSAPDLNTAELLRLAADGLLPADADLAHLLRDRAVELEDRSHLAQALLDVTGATAIAKASGTDPRLRYMSDPLFHAGVDHLAAMLPAWVNGLAAESEAAGAAMAARAAELAHLGHLTAGWGDLQIGSDGRTTTEGTPG